MKSSIIRNLCLFFVIIVIVQAGPSSTRKRIPRQQQHHEKFQYPKVRRDDSVQDDYFGTKVPDPYRWLEDPDSEETREFVKEQDAITVPYIEKFSGREEIRKKLETLQNYQKYGLPKQRENRYFFFLKDGLQDQYVLYVQEGLKGTPKILVDPLKLGNDTTTSLKFGKPSNDGQLVSYGLSRKGSDWVTIHFLNVTTGKEFPEVLKFSKWPGVEWTKDGHGVFYSRYPESTEGAGDGTETTANYDAKIYYHKLGTPQSEDILLVEFPDHPKWSLSAEPTDDNDYLIITAREGISFAKIYYLELSGFIKSGYKTKPEVKHLIGNFDARYEYVTSKGNIFYIITDNNAPNYKLVGIYANSPEEKYWATLLPESKTDVIDWVYPVNKDQMVVVYTHDVKSILQLRRLTDGSLIKDFKLEPGSISSVQGLAEHTQFFFEFASYLTPGIIYRVDLTQEDPEPQVYHEAVPEGFDASHYTTKQVFYFSKDGTRVPMFITYRKGLKLDGTAPTLLYGYGGFGSSIDPYFSTSYITFIQSFDGIVAVANIRGGGEYGTKWHDNGRQLHKQNVFDDFQAAAEYLIAEKYTKPSKLTIQGGSNGGLLVGACVNQRPDLYGAAIAEVGVHDMLRFHKFTIGYAWAGDYGTSDNKTQFEYLYKYSPLHNIRLPSNESVQYPAVLVTTADHDDRVVPLHSYKYISELQHTIGSSPRQTNPLMILIETDAGHGAGKPTSKKIGEVTDAYSFIARALNLKIVG